MLPLRLHSLFLSNILLLTSCELSGRVSTEFDDINDMINQLDWYRLSLGQQRLLLIIMNNAQRELGIQCFGSILCNRETFKKVYNIFN